MNYSMKTPALLFAGLLSAPPRPNRFRPVSIFWGSGAAGWPILLCGFQPVAEPVAVRYAWGLNPEGANLYGKNGLPASPFRTDNW